LFDVASFEVPGSQAASIYEPTSGNREGGILPSR
jgi:hypothetical protein